MKGAGRLAKRRKSKMELERMERIIAALNKEYHMEYRCFLDYETPWQLLIATILSAQCTDNRVNQVTKELFRKYPTLLDFAQAEQEELEQDIHSTGFYRNKAKNIIACARELIASYQGEVPKDIDALTNLAGVGRKTANVIRGNIYHEPSIVVDTHVKRISKRLGFTKEDDPVKIEFDLMDLLPKEQWILYNIHIITLGRSICTARSPKCEECFLQADCNYYNKQKDKTLIKVKKS
jgi:endonuclease-3